MTRWIVFEPPVRAGPTGEAVVTGPSDRAVFVRDAFAKWAVLFPFVWLLRHGLILMGLLALAASIGFGLLAERPGLGLAAAALPLLLGVLVALEGPSLRAARYRRKGYAETAVVDAPDEEEAAILYFAGSAGGHAKPETVPGPTPPDRRFDRSAFFATRMVRAEGRSLLDPARRR